MKNNRVTDMAILSLFIAIEVVLTLTPLGFIQIGPIRSTTLHIPVILAGLLLGYKHAFSVGLVFGILSVLTNTFMPTPTSFIFSPFYSFGGFNGNMYSLVIAIIPRVLFGMISLFVFNLLSKVNSTSIRVFISACIGSICHTMMVMGGIYVFFGPQYALAKDVPLGELINLIYIVVTTNGIIEMLVGAFVVMGAYKTLEKVIRKR